MSVQCVQMCIPVTVYGTHVTHALIYTIIWLWISTR